MKNKNKYDLKKLQDELAQKREELFRFKIDHSIGKLKDTSKIRKIRKEIARIMTKMNALKGKPEIRISKSQTNSKF